MQVLAALRLCRHIRRLVFFVGVITTRPIAAVYVKGVEAVHAPIADDAEEGLTKAGHSYPPATGNVAPRRSATAGDWTLRKGDASNRTARSPRTVSAVGHLPPSTPMIVNYKDDEPSRMRAAGLLKGTSASAGRIHRGGRVHVRHRVRRCQPLHATFVRLTYRRAWGAESARTPRSRPANPAIATTECSATGESSATAAECANPVLRQRVARADQEMTRRSSTAPRTPACVPTTRFREALRADADCGGKECNHCRAICSTNADCGDGYVCNGVETCAGGRCVAGVPPCGGGALCSEKKM